MFRLTTLPAFVVAAAVGWGQACISTAAVIAGDAFDYSPAGSNLIGKDGNGSTGFAGAWFGSDSFDLASGSLTDPGGALPVDGNRVTCASYGGNRDAHRLFDTTIGLHDTTIYFSFLMRPEGTLGGGAWDGWFGWALRGEDARFPDLFLGKPSYNERYVIESAGGAGQIVTSEPTVVGQTAFFVLRADFTAGADTFRLYVNPTPGAAEPTTADAVLTGLNLGAPRGVSLTGPGAFSFDEFRVTTTFGEAAPVPEPSTLVLLAVAAAGLLGYGWRRRSLSR